MHKLATCKFDVVDEILSGDPTLLCLITDPMDDTVKEAHVPSEEEQQGIDRTNVGLVLHVPSVGRFNKFAHTSAPLTQINAQLLAVKAPTLPDEVVKVAAFYLKRASKRWGVEFPEFLEKYAEEDPGHNIVRTDEINDQAWSKKLRDNALMAKKAQLDSQPDGGFALPLDRKFPITTTEQIKTACSYFDHYHSELGLGDVLTFARNLNQAAEDKQVEMAGQYSKYANLDLTRFGEQLDSQLEKRQAIAPESDKNIAGSYENLGKRRDEFGPMKTAALVEAIDESWNAKRHYGVTFHDPLLSTLHTEKLAHVEVDGRAVSTADLSKLAEKDLTCIDEMTKKDLLGSEGLNVFKSLPLPVRASLYEDM